MPFCEECLSSPQYSRHNSFFFCVLPVYYFSLIYFQMLGKLSKCSKSSSWVLYKWASNLINGRKTLFASSVFVSLSNRINTRLIKVAETIVLDAIQQNFFKCFIKISSSGTRQCWKVWTRTICGLLSWLLRPCRVRLYFNADNELKLCSVNWSAIWNFTRLVCLMTWINLFNRSNQNSASAAVFVHMKSILINLSFVF